MTKQEVIQKAWGEIWNELPERQKECALKYDGCVSHSEYRLELSYDDQNLAIKLNKISKIKDSWLLNDQFYFRPKSLSGIENNNGWTLIWEKVLPFTDIECYFITNENRLYTGKYIFKTRCFKDYNGNIYPVYTITHYQPIQKPKPPIY